MMGSGVIKKRGIDDPNLSWRPRALRIAVRERRPVRPADFERHHVIVNDDDLPFFARFESGRRTVLPSSRFLPPALRALPPFVSRKGRRTWWSFRSGPLHGWHIQQLLKISGILQLPHQRFCIVDSDNVFFGLFDVAAYAGADTIPLYIERQAILADAPLHAVWVRNADRLLGGGPTSFPADDYIGNGLVWDKSTVRDMTATIEAVSGMPWAVALGKARSFSEYILLMATLLASRRPIWRGTG